MRRFLTYWTLTFLLFLPSWGLTALRGMAHPIDLVWTAALTGFLAGLATRSGSRAPSHSMSRNPGEAG